MLPEDRATRRQTRISSMPSPTSLARAPLALLLLLVLPLAAGGPAAARTPDLLVTNKLNPSETGYELRPLAGTTVDAAGRTLGIYVDNSDMIAPPTQNANLDGEPAAEDRVAGFGQVVDGKGQRRLDTSWYWGLQQLEPEEEALDPREQWSRNPFAFDLDDDGRDELVVWGRRNLVVGTLDAP